MESDESKLLHPVSYVFLTNNGLQKTGRTGNGAICLILEENMLQRPCILACLECFQNHLIHSWETRAEENCITIAAVQGVMQAEFFLTSSKHRALKTLFKTHPHP